MTHSVLRRAIIPGLILSLLLLFCGCQAGMAAQLLPDTIITPTSKGKEELLTALEQDYTKRFHISGHFVRGSDTTAEAVFQYIQQNSGEDSDAVRRLLAEDDTDEYYRVCCAAQLTAQLQEKLLLPSGEALWVSYAELPSDILTEDGTLREGADYADTAHTLIDNQKLLVWADVSPANSQQVGFAVGTIGGKAFVIAVFSA